MAATKPAGVFVSVSGRSCNQGTACQGFQEAKEAMKLPEERVLAGR